MLEITWLSDEQAEIFQSDFRIVADYFVHMRKNKENDKKRQKNMYYLSKIFAVICSGESGLNLKGG